MLRVRSRLSRSRTSSEEETSLSAPTDAAPEVVQLLHFSIASKEFTVSAEQLAQVCVPFQALRSANDQTAKGTGLGLVLAGELLSLLPRGGLFFMRAGRTTETDDEDTTEDEDVSRASPPRPLDWSTTQQVVLRFPLECGEEVAAIDGGDADVLIPTVHAVVQQSKWESLEVHEDPATSLSVASAAATLPVVSSQDDAATPLTTPSEVSSLTDQPPAETHPVKIGSEEREGPEHTWNVLVVDGERPCFVCLDRLISDFILRI